MSGSSKTSTCTFHFEYFLFLFLLTSDPRDNDFGRHVYCILYPTGTQTKDWPSAAGLMPASNNTIKSSGEVWSVMWNEDLKVKHLTIGYAINAYRGKYFYCYRH